MKNELIHKIEAILFYLAEPVEVDFLVKTLEMEKEDVLSAIGELGLSLEKRGVRLVFHNDEVSMVTAPDFFDIIEKIVKEERERDLGRAGLETLTIVAYKGPVSKKEIEYIRGVNCQWAIRSLLLRGLIEKQETDGRGSSYVITNDTVRYLGLGHISELPEYAEVQKQLTVEETEEEQNDEQRTE